MTLIQALILGIIQGLTEFLPISSTAHLCFIPQWIGWGDPGAALTAVLQLGTLAAVVLYFRDDILRLVRSLGHDLRSRSFCSTPDSKQAWMIAVGTVPVVMCGLTFKEQIKGPLRQLTSIALSAIGFALLLALAEYRTWRRLRQGALVREESAISWFDVLFIGCFQAFALIPGASRSGVTITAGLFVGLSRSASARFSFLLSLPAVFAAGVYEFYKDRNEIIGASSSISSLCVALLVSGVLGYLSIAFLLGFLKKHATWIFIIYRLLLGTTLLFLLRDGLLQPSP